MLGGIGGKRRRGRQRMRWLDGITDSVDSGWTPGVGDGQGGLACWDSWGRKESDAAERLNWLTDWHGLCFCFCFLIFHLVLFYWIMVVNILLIPRSFYFLSVLILLDFSVASNTSNLSDIFFNPLLSSYYFFFLCLCPFWKLSTYCFCFPVPTEYFTFPLPLPTV